MKRYMKQYDRRFNDSEMIECDDGEWVKWDDVKKFVEFDCDRAEKEADGKCLGYGKSEIDDEPIEKCKQCTKQSSYESEV